VGIFGTENLPLQQEKMERVVIDMSKKEEEEQEEDQEEEQEQEKERQQEKEREQVKEREQEKEEEEFETHEHIKGGGGGGGDGEEEEEEEEEAPRDPEAQCWICYNEGCEDEVIRCCKCKGSIEFVHSACLLKWIDTSGKNKCGRCEEEYIVAQLYRKPWHRHLSSRWFELVGALAVMSLMFILIDFFLFRRLFSTRFSIHGRMGGMGMGGGIGGGMNFYFYLFKFEVISCIAFIAIFCVYKLLKFYSRRGLGEVFCDKFESHWNTFTSLYYEGGGGGGGGPAAAYVVPPHESLHGVNFFALAQIVFMTLFDVLREAKTKWLRSERRVMSFKG
jgi:hypothetical protein